MGEDLDLPWVHTRDGIEDAEYSHLSSTQDGFGDIATVWSPNAKAKTAYIVLAANHHHRLVKLLTELTALVRGECPSLLNEDSGGNARLSLGIDEALAVFKEASNERP